MKPDAGRGEAAEIGVPAPDSDVLGTTRAPDEARVVVRGRGPARCHRRRVHHRVRPEAEDGVVGVRGQQRPVQEARAVSCRRRLRRHRCCCRSSGAL